jgi:hypothetical protein
VLGRCFGTQGKQKLLCQFSLILENEAGVCFLFVIDDLVAALKNFLAISFNK